MGRQSPWRSLGLDSGKVNWKTSPLSRFALARGRLRTILLPLFIPSTTGPAEKEQIADDCKASRYNHCG